MIDLNLLAFIDVLIVYIDAFDVVVVDLFVFEDF